MLLFWFIAKLSWIHKLDLAFVIDTYLFGKA